MVTSVLATHYVVARNRLMGVGGKTGQQLAMCDSVNECQAIIDDEIVRRWSSLDEDEVFEEIKRQAGE